MILLALECSSPRRSVAIAQDGRVLAETAHGAERGTPLFSMIEETLALAGLPRDAVDHVALGLGPGSYTGIRTAIAAAQGWALAQSVPLVGVDSAAACARRGRATGLRGPAAIVIDAQRGEFYVAEYDLTTAEARPRSSLRLASRAEVEHLRATGATLAGPEVARFGFTGVTVMPDAAAVAELAWAGEAIVEPRGETLEPLYLRATTFVKAPPPRLPG